MTVKTSLGLIVRISGKTPAPPELGKPEVDVKMLVKKGINPSKQRKGRSGEIARTGGKGARR